ncbi:box C/D snoRNA protein 1-like [Trifolium pratense]|uniref:box C/D snoRNA protein 1-like n=1 Tax=Trifolium pratense TaxID=57577 RepID=UPI001E691D5E|nr:box C/D snoRNA protein 1-like [Trifolium pratense]
MSTSVSETEEQVEKVPIRTIGKTLTQCGECKSNPSKYKCPGCSIQSCSLPCVKAHKLRTGCTGKRNQTQFVHISKFNDSILLSDYNLLEEVKRVSEAASRMRSKLGMSTNFRLPHHLKSLQNAARSRRTKLRFLPNGMSKREKNQSQYDYRKKTIHWTIEWRFHSTNVVLHDHRVDENTNFCSILEKHLKPGPWNHPLKEFCDDQLDCLKLFIRKYPKGPKSPFKELDMKAPIKQQLENVVILEYPVVFVFLPSHSIDFEVIKAVNPSIPKSPPNDSEIIPIPEGLSFREEVIEDDNNSDDPKVFDLMKQVESSSAHQVHTENNNSDEVLNDSLDISVFEGDVEGNLSPSSLLDRELNLFEDGTLAFDQDFMDDTFADLMRHLSSEEFLDFDSVFANNDENDIGLLAPIEEFPVPEELEEGEIQE